MNRGPLNGFAINGASGDPVVRIRVDAKGYARIRASGRVLSYGVVAATAQADLQGVLGRVNAKLTIGGVARAAIGGALGRAEIHGIIQSTGRAVVHVVLPPIRLRVNAKGRAGIGLKAHLEARNAVTGNGQARAVLKPRLLRRGPVAAQGVAQIAADGVVYVRRWLRSPTEGKAEAFIVSTSRVDARLAALVQAKAVPTAEFTILARAPLQCTVVAFIEIDPSIHKRLPFDEPAPESRTFLVPPAMTTFYVTDQGTAMFRVSPPMQPADVQDFDIEFAEWFPPGDEIVSVELKVAPAMPMPPSYAFVSQRVKVWVYAGGTSGEKYQISVKATTNDGRVKEVELVVPIKEQ